MEIVIGSLVSLIVQYLKSAFGTETPATLTIVFILSLIGASVYVYLSATPFWPEFVQVLTTAGAFYAFILQRFESQ